MTIAISFHRLVLIAISTLIVPWPLLGGGGGVRPIAQVGGATQGIAVQGNYAYVGVGLRLVVLDISDATHLRQIGATAPFPEFVQAVAVNGATAYVADGSGGLRVVDVSSATAPKEVGSWESPGYARDVAVAGTTAYVADGPYGLRIIDVTNPGQPKALAAAFAMSYAYGVAVDAGYAYMAAGGGGLRIADVVDPAHPIELATMETPGYSYGVAVDGSRVYVADGWAGLRVVDVADKRSPVEVGSVRTPGQAFDVAVSESRAYVADAFKGLRVIDVAGASRPYEIGSYKGDLSHAGGVAVSGGIAYVTDREGGLRAISIANPTAAAEVGRYAPLGYADAVTVAGNYAYVAAGPYDLSVIDISNPSVPREVGSLRLSIGSFDRYATAVAVVDHYAYICNGSHLYTADVSDPARPIAGASVEFRVPHGDGFGSGMCREMTVENGIAYVAIEHGLALLSLTSPLNPSQVGFIQLEQYTAGGDIAVGVAVQGTTAYVAVERGGLRVVDTTDPHNMRVVGSLGKGGETFFDDLVIVDNKAYLAGSGLWIVDVSTPSAPREVSYLATTGHAYGIALSGTTAHLANADAGLWSVDVGDAARPVTSGTVRTVGYSHGVYVAGDRVYVADGPGGLLILEASSTTLALREPADDRDADKPPPIATRASSASPLSRVVSSHHPVRNESVVGIAPTTDASGTCIVTSIADSGAGSFRSCLEAAGPGTTITFDTIVFPAGSPSTILLATPLPDLNPGGISVMAAGAGVILDGSGISGYADGLRLTDHNVIAGLQIRKFSGHGISILGEGNVIGRGNIIGGNALCGINLSGARVKANVIVGNLIGLDASGEQANGNGDQGIFIFDDASMNRVGGTAPEDRNVVSGNGKDGIAVMTGSSENVIIGNYVGVDLTGGIAIRNGSHGISMQVRAFNNRVVGNVSSGNGRAGILINDWGSSYNTVIGNYVGTDAAGEFAIPNGEDGIGVGGGGSFNRIGGRYPFERNVVSGSRAISVSQIGAENLILGNFAGTDASGSRAIRNAPPITGIELGGSGPTIVGGATGAEANLISGGVVRIASRHNHAIGNYIGTVAGGQGIIINSSGVTAGTGAHNIIQGNVIANSLPGGVGVQVNTSSSNTIRRNSIYANDRSGIEHTNGGNGLLPSPVITAVTTTAVSGSACPGCTVEIFSDAAGQGRFFEGETLANAAGAFSFDKGSYMLGGFVTATATDGAGNTSQFSIPRSMRRNETNATITNIAPTPSALGQPVTVSFTVTGAAAGGRTPTGNVTISDGLSRCTAILPATTCSITLLAAGKRSLVATYSGDASFNGSVSAVVSQSVSKARSFVTLTSSWVAQTVTLRATVASVGPAPSGLVTFKGGSTDLGIVEVSGGEAVLAMPATSGSHTFFAVYSGDSNYDASNSPKSPVRRRAVRP